MEPTNLEPYNFRKPLGLSSNIFWAGDVSLNFWMFSMVSSSAKPSMRDMKLKEYSLEELCWIESAAAEALLPQPLHEALAVSCKNELSSCKDSIFLDLVSSTWFFTLFFMQAVCPWEPQSWISSSAGGLPQLLDRSKLSLKEQPSSHGMLTSAAAEASRVTHSPMGRSHWGDDLDRTGTSHLASLGTKPKWLKRWPQFLKSWQSTGANNDDWISNAWPWGNNPAHSTWIRFNGF